MTIYYYEMLRNPSPTRGEGFDLLVACYAVITPTPFTFFTVTP